MIFQEVMKYTPDRECLMTLINVNKIDRVYIVEKYLERWLRGIPVDSRVIQLRDDRGVLTVVWSDMRAFYMNFQDVERIWSACNEVCINHYIKDKMRLVREVC